MEFSARGKLLLTGEYSVLRGALALSVPTKFGQRLTVNESVDAVLSWISLDQNGDTWFSATLANGTSIVNTSDVKICERLIKVLLAAKKLNPNFELQNREVTTHLDFDRKWGLGTSSTLVALIAKWAKVDALKLFFNSMSGSGYDVATAVANSPILYQLVEGDAFFKNVKFSPPFKDKLFFVYLGNKQHSDLAVKDFANQEVSLNQIDEISNLTKHVLQSQTLEEFENLMLEHEALTSILLKSITIFESQFSDYPNIVKSLGAWGGDFVLATGTEKHQEYFRNKGFSTILTWNEMIGM